MVDRHMEHVGNPDGYGDGRRVVAVLDGIHRLPADAHTLGQCLLRHLIILESEPPDLIRKFLQNVILDECPKPWLSKEIDNKSSYYDLRQVRPTPRQPRLTDTGSGIGDLLDLMSSIPDGLSPSPGHF